MNTNALDSIPINVHMLLTEDQLKAIPPNIEIVANWGAITIRYEENEVKYMDGTHVAISGPKTDIIKWLKPFGYFWLGVGSPMLQNFELYGLDKLGVG
jgi:hypothetical protein